jgi:hypothetical protein
MNTERTRDTIELLSMRALEIELNPYHPNGDDIIAAYEIVIEELEKLLHFYSKGTWV